MAQANRRSITRIPPVEPTPKSAPPFRITIRPESPAADIGRHISTAITDLQDLARVVTLMKGEGTTARHIRKTMTSREYAALRHYLETEGNLGDYWREAGLGDRS